MVVRYGCFVGKDDFEKMAPADNGAWIKYEDYTKRIAELEAKLSALEQAARRLVDHAKDSKQELWATLPDVLNLSDVLDKMEDIENEKP